MAARIRDAMAKVVPGLVLAVLLLGGCATMGAMDFATTRAMHFGTTATSGPLVTLVVSEDRAVVQRECRDVPAVGPILGCQMSRLVVLSGDQIGRSVKVVRYTDSLPSAMAMEIDIHELCHVVAALQGIPDPCHNENNGVLQSALVSSPHLW